MLNEKLNRSTHPSFYGLVFSSYHLRRVDKEAYFYQDVDNNYSYSSSSCFCRIIAILHVFLLKSIGFLWTRTILCKKFYMKFCTWTSAQFFTDNHNFLLVNSLFSWRMLFFLIKMWIQASVKFIRGIWQ